MTRSPGDAVRAAELDSQKAAGADPNWSHRCLQAVRTCFGIPARYQSAQEAWEHSEQRSGPPPLGAPIWFRVGKLGHIAIAAEPGMCWTIDFRRRGRFDHVSTWTLAQRWGPYLGWSSTLNGQPIPGL